MTHPWAGWTDGLQYQAWQMMSQIGQGGRLDPTRAQLERLARCSNECGGWSVLDQEREKAFVALDDWAVRYDTGTSG